MLVSVEDIRSYLGGITLEPGMSAVLEDTIARAQKMVETYLNRPVEKVQVREVVRSDSKGYLYLSVTPVWKVISYGGATAAQSIPTTVTTPYTLVPDASLGSDPRIIDKVAETITSDTYFTDITSPGKLFAGSPYASYVVEYIGGLDPNQIDDIKRVIIQLVAREWGSNHIADVGFSGGNPEPVDQQDTRGWSLADDEKQDIQRYRRRVAL